MSIWHPSRLLFDLDGTLVDSTAVVDRCWTALAERLGVEPETVVGRYHGMPANVALPMVDPSLEPAEVDELHRWLLSLEVADTDGIVALPGAADLLTSLPDDAWTIVTSCTHELAELRLAAAGLPVPALMVCSDDVARGKPDPEPYLLGARRTGTPPAECLVVEDAPAGVASARAAGCDVVGVLTTHDSLDTVTVGSLADLDVTVDAGRVTVAVA
ncbi:HAD-IA family hydrolase [Nocardioides sp. C4-1]|uniref:HAD-IA family hydrolase n=1 Tax=Nocardioides sp. C4-1 TaxID=3151851 RepID=UPI0032663C51